MCTLPPAMTKFRGPEALGAALAAAPVRALSPYERALFEVDLGAPLNFTTAAKVSGPLTAEVVRRALPAVQARHPPLGWRIRRGEGGAPAFVAGAPPLELAEVAGPSPFAEIESDVNRPIDSTSGPLARVTLVDCGGEGRWLLATLHHAIGDGMSGAFLIRDLLRACAQAAAGQAPALPPLPPTVPLDRAIPPSALGLRGLRNGFRFLWQELWLGLRHGRPFKVRRDDPAPTPAYARRARVLPRTFEPPEAERLAARARAEGTTVHGALSAALILGVLADAGLDEGRVAFGSPANVRQQLSPPVGEDLGFYVSMVAFRAAVRSDMAFWDLARAVRREAEKDLARSAQLSLLTLMSRLLGPLAGIGKLEPRAMIDRFERNVVTTTGLTNLGRLAIETAYPPFALERCFFAVSPSALGDFVATSTSVQGRIEWIFVWPEPVMTEAHATALVDDIVERVRRAL